MTVHKSPAIENSDFVKPEEDTGAIEYAVCQLLTHIIKQNDDSEVPPNREFGSFSEKWTYEWVDIGEYIDRCREWVVCGPESYIVAMGLLQRLEQLEAIPVITQRTVHRIFYTVFMLAVKTLEDSTLCNSDFAKVGCVTVNQLNEMELLALLALGFNTTISPVEYNHCRHLLLSQFSRAKGKALFSRSPKPSPVPTKQDGTMMLGDIIPASQDTHDVPAASPAPPPDEVDDILVPLPSTDKKKKKRIFSRMAKMFRKNKKDTASSSAEESESGKDITMHEEELMDDSSAANAKNYRHNYSNNPHGHPMHTDFASSKRKSVELGYILSEKRKESLRLSGKYAADDIMVEQVSQQATQHAKQQSALKNRTTKPADVTHSARSHLEDDEDEIEAQNEINMHQAGKASPGAAHLMVRQHSL